MRNSSVDPDLAPALTVYATDLTLIGTALRPLEGFSQKGNGTASSLPLLPTLCGSTGPFGLNGSLVASYVQEALLRFPH